MKNLRIISLLFVLIGAFFVIAYQPAMAQAGSVSISPGLIDVDVSQQQPENKVTITLTNSYPQSVSLVPALRAIDLDSGSLAPTDKAEEALANNIILSSDVITIPANSSIPYEVVLKNTPELSPGGHYAALVFSSATTGEGSINLQSAISVNIFLVKRGGEVQSVALAAYKINRFFLSFPSSVDLTFKNDGNVHVVPRASVSIVKAGESETVQKGIANENSATVFPNQSLSVTVHTKTVRTTWLPGTYTIRINSRADGIDGSEVVSKTLFVVPLPFIGLCFSLVLLSALALRLFLRRRRRRALLLTRKTNVPKTTIQAGDKVEVRIVRRSRPIPADISPRKSVKQRDNSI